MTTHIKSSKEGFVLCGEMVDKRTLFESPYRCSCYYCNLAFENKEKNLKGWEHESTN